MYMSVPFFEITEQQRVNVLKHSYPWLLGLHRSGWEHVCKVHWPFLSPQPGWEIHTFSWFWSWPMFNIGLWLTLKHWLGKKLPHFWSYLSPVLVQTSFSLAVRCHSTSFCLKSSFASLRFRCFALIQILCQFIKFTRPMTCFLMIASGWLVIPQYKYRALDQI